MVVKRVQPTIQNYGVLYGDCPWEYKNFADAAHGAARNHYDTMDLERLKALRPMIDEWAAKDCILALWATWPKLDQAFAVIDAWGFEYVTGTPWLKIVPDAGTIKTGIGFWWQSCSEILLICRRGSPKSERLPLLALLAGPERNFYGKDGQPIYCDKIGGHSSKPLGVREWLTHKLDGPYLEMFATTQAEGWTAYGRALGTEITPEGVVPYAPESATRDVRGEQRARSKLHEPEIKLISRVTTYTNGSTKDNLKYSIRFTVPTDVGVATFSISGPKPHVVGWRRADIGAPRPRKIGWRRTDIGKEAA